MHPDKSLAKTTIFLQDACYQHRFIRSNDLSAIVERPERLRALKIGLSAAIARLEEAGSLTPNKPPLGSINVANDAGDDLAAALQKLDLLQDVKVEVVNIIKSSSFVDVLNNEAVKFVHGDIDGDVYLQNLVNWAKESAEKIKAGQSEIPESFSQGDLYLCPESLDAIQGALGTICEAVDKVIESPKRRNEQKSDESSSTVVHTNAFVAIRPPGHHCGEDTPSGFCFVNNVVVAAAHAHLKHGIKKVVIFDIDLHHGNGTQSLVWQINEETYRQKLEGEAGSPLTKPGLEIFYGSIHDILSYPCEDGKVSMVQAASVSIHGPHGQYIENIHLKPYSSEEDFWQNLYSTQYSKLLEKGKAFVGDASGDDVLVFISCGFDACEHEYPSMSRHNRRVPVSFYHRFAVDARGFADELAKGKLISVLEGGYSDRALISGGMAHLSGLVDVQALGIKVDKGWWKLENLTALEKSTKKRRGGKLSMPGSGEKWLERAIAIFQSIDTTITPSPSRNHVPLPPSSMTLRERKPMSRAASLKASPQPSRRMKGKLPQSDAIVAPTIEPVDDVVKTLEGLNLDKQDKVTTEEGLGEVKKLPRVILRLKEPGSS
ncbi:Arginase/deacetylase [Phellopilus nigrolimitatus]|nr:Arginase/deacetylase [Phellopilus nigrolimitatus]